MTSAQKECPRRIAALAARTPDESRALADHLRQYEGIEPALFLPRDADELNEALAAGRFDLVIFPSIDALTIAMCDDHANLERWRQAGAQFEIAGRIHPDPPNQTIAEIGRSFTDWQDRIRRRQTTTALILTALALAAMTALLWLIPPAR